TAGTPDLRANNRTNSKSDVNGASTDSNSGGDALNGSAPLSGTVAYVAGNVTAGGDLSVQAKENVTASVLVGQGEVGLVGVGAAVAVLNVHSNTQAFLASDAGVAVTGTININAVFDDNTSVEIRQGTGGAFVGRGVEVAINNDDSNQLAYIADNARIDKASAVTVSAQANRTVLVDTGSVTFGGIFALGFSGATATAGGTTLASVGSGA